MGKVQATPAVLLEQSARNWATVLKGGEELACVGKAQANSAKDRPTLFNHFDISRCLPVRIRACGL